jgi:hypothetical protein
MIAAAQPSVLRVFEISKFDSVLRLTGSVTTALAALRP